MAVGSGDTDAFDANGDIYISGGTIDVTAQSAFDFDGTAELTGGTVTVNGEQITNHSNRTRCRWPRWLVIDRQIIIKRSKS